MAKNKAFIIVLVVLLAFFLSGNLSIIPFTFAGFIWQDAGTLYRDGNLLSGSQSCNVGSGSGSVAKDMETLVISASASGNYVERSINTDLTNIDEVLVIYEGFGNAQCSSGHSGSTSSISGAILGNDNEGVGLGESVSCDSSITSASKSFIPSIWKFRNNFDGTWSSLQALGVGDIFIVKNTLPVIGTPRLVLKAAAGNGCGNYGSGVASLKIYNVVVKENAFAVCKADEFWQDKNGDKKPTVDECFNLQTIVLNSEEAIKESFDAKLLRIETELNAKISGLSSQLQAQQAAQTLSDAEIAALKEELASAKSNLNAVVAGDSNVIATIEAQEKFEEPNIIRKFFNAIIAFIINLWTKFKDIILIILPP